MYSGMKTSTPGRRDGAGTFVVVEQEELLGEEKEEGEEEEGAGKKHEGICIRLPGIIDQSDSHFCWNVTEKNVA